MRDRLCSVFIGLTMILLMAACGTAQEPKLPVIPPTFSNAAYGSHERHVLDFWQAKSNTPTPLLLSIHGGGFVAGDKTVPPQLLKDCLDAGISVAAINYRYSTQAIAPAAFLDGARAVQFLRTKAKEWNIDPKRVASSGESAGAGISLWLGFHDDLVDATSSDPVARESTRLTCMVVFEGQSFYDPRRVRDLFPGKDVHKIMPLRRLFDFDPEQIDQLPPEKYELFEEVSAITHLTRDDPPAMLWYANPFDAEVTTTRIGIHHPVFGKILKEKMDELKIECEVVADGKRLDGQPPSLSIDFLQRQFKMAK